MLALTALVATFDCTAATAQQRMSLDGIWQIQREQEPNTNYQSVHVPGCFETVRGIDARCVLEGVDDSFHIWLNGELLGVIGDEATKTTTWLEQQVAELKQKLRPGSRNTIVLRVVDHAGAGEPWKPVRLTTGPIGTSCQLLR